jgi:hypothetical protein
VLAGSARGSGFNVRRGLRSYSRTRVGRIVRADSVFFCIARRVQRRGATGSSKSSSTIVIVFFEVHTITTTAAATASAAAIATAPALTHHPSSLSKSAERGWTPLRRQTQSFKNNLGFFISV